MAKLKKKHEFDDIIKQRRAEAKEVLTALQFGPKQTNDLAIRTLLALLSLRPDMAWADAKAPLCGITPIIGFIGHSYPPQPAPNTRESIRDDVVKFFVGVGMVMLNLNVRRVSKQFVDRKPPGGTLQ